MAISDPKSRTPRGCQKFPPAVVLGVCVHGLATVRALSSRGVQVHALEQDRHCPGAHTWRAKLHFVQDINGNQLIDSLLQLREKEVPDGSPVLFPINDNMVRTIATHWPRLKDHYRLSWSDKYDQIAQMLDKTWIEDRCNALGLRYPKTHYIEGVEDLEAESMELGYPLIVKPSTPLSQFKTCLVRSAHELKDVVMTYTNSLPFLIQELIPGSDDSIVFGALYLDRGCTIARFEGQKVSSHPPAMGQTTSAITLMDDDVHEHASRFFHGLELTGPVSVEFKRDSEGRLWVIEPTVGRTDFWVDCCIASGVNLPYLNYRISLGLTPETCSHPSLAVWCDTAKDPQSYLRAVWRSRGRVLRMRPRFAYLTLRDPVPAIYGAMVLVRRILRKLVRMANRAAR